MVGKKLKQNKLFKTFFSDDSQSNSFIGKQVVSFTINCWFKSSLPHHVKYALVVQWIRINDYGSFDSGSNPLESTKGQFGLGGRLVCKTNGVGSIPTLTSEKVVNVKYNGYFYYNEM